MSWIQRHGLNELERLLRELEEYSRGCTSLVVSEWRTPEYIAGRIGFGHELIRDLRTEFGTKVVLAEKKGA